MTTATPRQTGPNQPDLRTEQLRGRLTQKHLARKFWLGLIPEVAVPA